MISDYLNGDVDDVGKIFHPGRGLSNSVREQCLPTLVEAFHAKIFADNRHMAPPRP
jgi:hypothetical protein